MLEAQEPSRQPLLLCLFRVRANGRSFRRDSEDNELDPVVFGTRRRQALQLQAWVL